MHYPDLGFLQSIQSAGNRLPQPASPEDAQRTIAQLTGTLDDAIAHPAGLALIQAMAGNAPYLARLLKLQAPFFAELCRDGPEICFRRILERLSGLKAGDVSQAELARALRLAKQQVALLTAAADIGRQWDVMTVTHYLSDFADAAIVHGCDWLLMQAHKRGELALPDLTRPQHGSGLLVLGMGKLGAHELNYSSDIDLIILFDKAAAPYVGARNVQHCFTRLAQDLAALLQDRTADGYVFRTDLRLRPDPRSTPPAVSLDSAVTYYESLGQNWERAAMIKARAIAGDAEAAARFERHITPYIWRKHLDFAAIADIHSIKRQMTSKAGEAMAIGGHNIKLGRGGIREIEFYVQTQQLVWGGRYPGLRGKPTLATLEALVTHERITPEAAATMADSYRFLRRVEHHLQMIDDAQTHTLPDNDADLLRLAIFLGYPNLFSFTQDLLRHCEQVHSLYTGSMEGSPPLAIDGNLVFTGVEADPETLKTLNRLGYTQAQQVSDIIQGWHRGSRRATRSKRARQILTELIPAILTELADTAHPDQAFTRFDDFLARLPAGVQIFSLFAARPELLDLLAHILGSAPALADILARQPHLLDTVLQGDFYAPLPARAELEAELNRRLARCGNYEEALSTLRGFKNERHFQAGIQMLRGLTRPSKIGYFLSDLADLLLSGVVAQAQREFATTHGTIAGAHLAVIGLGKLGSRELTFGSDLDIILIYEGPDGAQSTGAKSVDLQTYYNRLCSRTVSACTLLTREGVLYEIDTRLRPSGGDSPVATQLSAFDHYFEALAWIFEFMALTKARVVVSESDSLRHRLHHAIDRHLRRRYDPTELAEEVTAMREKVFAQYRTQNPWDIKHVRGGLMDLDFLAQYLVLRHAADSPALLQTNTYNILAAAADAGHIPMALAETLMQAHGFLADLLSFLRLCSPNARIEESTPQGLKNLLVERFAAADFAALEQRLVATQQMVFEQFQLVREW